MITLVRMSSFPNQVIVLEGKVVTPLLKTKIAISKVTFLEVCQLCNFEFHNHKSLIRNQELAFERFRMKDPSSESNMVSKYETEVEMLKITFRKSGVLPDPYDKLVLLYLGRNVLHIRELSEI